MFDARKPRLPRKKMKVVVRGRYVLPPEGYFSQVLYASPDWIVKSSIERFDELLKVAYLPLITEALNQPSVIMETFK